MAELELLNHKEKLYWDENKYKEDRQFEVYKFIGRCYSTISITELRNLGIQYNDDLRIEQNDDEYEIYHKLPNTDGSYQKYWDMIMRQKKEREEYNKNLEREQYERLKKKYG